ncbi:MAG TPA: lipid-A-disaccharide synthase [Chthoniobacterales bacterium]
MMLYLIAGEASGDAHGAALLRELLKLRPGLEWRGAGGPQMNAVAPGRIFLWTHEAVVGLWDVLLKYGYFRAQFHRMHREILGLHPKAVIFVDYPGFNLRLARYLKATGYRGQLIFYISPQVWAWNRGRIPKMARFLDLMLCIFPFEPSLYRQSGLRAEFVGHPLVAQLSRRRLAGDRDRDLVGLFPGSRGREVKRIFPIMLEAARRLRERQAGLRFYAAAVNEDAAFTMRRCAARAGFAGLEIGVGNAHELMQRAWVGMVASGTATMEASYFGLPFVLIYKVSWLTYLIGRAVIRVDHLGMPNLLAERTLIPEFIQHRANPAAIAQTLERLCNDSAARARMLEGMLEVIGKLGLEDTGQHAARVISEHLGETPAAV